MAIDTTNLTIALEEGERWHRTFSVVVPADAVQAERKLIADQLAKRLKLPGFRKGRIPAGVVEQRYGQVLDQELLDKVIGQAYQHALRENDLAPISEGQIEKVQFEPKEDISFTIGFDVQPEIELNRLGDFTVEKPTAAVEDEQLEQVLDRLREQNASWKPIEGGKAEDGNLVMVTLQKIEEEEALEERPYQLVVGQGDAIPDVEEAIKSLEMGATGDFVVRFPDDFPNEERRGEEEQLRITLNGRQEQELPDLNDEFAASVGEFDNLEALKAKILDDLQREAEERSEGALRSNLLEEVVSANPFTVPVSMVNRYVDSLWGLDGGGARKDEVSEEQLAEARERFSPEAERAVKQILVIERLADTQKLRATEDEIDERVEEIAEKAGENPSQVYAKLQKAERLEALEREITERKVFDFLKSQSKITEK
jgi:trigger factor